jgi:hypothetical protein
MSAARPSRKARFAWKATLSRDTARAMSKENVEIARTLYPGEIGL